MKIESIIKSALTFAVQQPDAGETSAQIHRNRSKNFVEALASEFKTHFTSKTDVRVLSKHCNENRADFGLNELLFDVLVCETATVESSYGKKKLRHVTKGLWAVESELARDSNQAVYDFNKLVLSNCENNLFIGPITSNDKQFIEPLIKVAKHCSGNVLIALIPHPAQWVPGVEEVRVFGMKDYGNM